MNPTAETRPDAPPRQPPAPAFLLTIPAVIAIVLRLIAHGRERAATLPARAAEPGFARTARLIGSADPAVIAICIQRGLRRAAALCARLARRQARGLGVALRALPLDGGTQGAGASAATPRTARSYWWHTADLSYLPTEAEAAQEARIRCDGCLLMAISLDVGIDLTAPGSPWRDVLMPISLCGGSGPALDWEARRRLGELSGRPDDHAPWPRRRRAAGGTAVPAEQRTLQEALPRQDARAPQESRPHQEARPQRAAPCVALPQHEFAGCPPPEPYAAGRTIGVTPADPAPAMPWPVLPSPALEVAATGPD